MTDVDDLYDGRTRYWTDNLHCRKIYFMAKIKETDFLTRFRTDYGFIDFTGAMKERAKEIELRRSYYVQLADASKRIVDFIPV